ncbi:MAG TPA: flagellar protein FlgN [Syntrophaceticus sp.]|nr:flagellar protein FlgN [Syntrophaceticus sp.]
MQDVNSKTENWPLGKGDQLADWISEQEQIVNSLIELSLKKRSLLMELPTSEEQLKELNGIIAQESQFLLNLQEAEKQLAEMPQELSRALVQQELAERFSAVQSNFERLKELNQENRSLLASLLQYINFSLDLFCQNPSGGIYRESPNKNGEVEKVAVRSGQFDRQV